MRPEGSDDIDDAEENQDWWHDPDERKRDERGEDEHPHPHPRAEETHLLRARRRHVQHSDRHDRDTQDVDPWFGRRRESEQAKQSVGRSNEDSAKREEVHPEDVNTACGWSHERAPMRVP